MLCIRPTIGRFAMDESRAAFISTPWVARGVVVPAVDRRGMGGFRAPQFVEKRSSILAGSFVFKR